ncbi:MAG: RsmB/NOP family class I SAM-dependent RNA methyltransferase [Streptosporangiaceae bacterium]
MAERARPSRPRATGAAKSRNDRTSEPGRRQAPHQARRRADPARRAAYDVLRAVADRDAYANLLLPALLTERGLTGRDAAFATELTYGTLRGRGTYDAIVAACSDRDQLDPTVRDVLRLGAHQLLATRVGPHAAVATSVDLAKDVCGPRPSGFVNAVLRRVATRDLDAWTEIVAPSRDRDPDGYLAVRHSYPRWIVEAFADALGPASSAELEAALAAGNLRPDVILAVTPGRPATQNPATQDPATQDPDRADPDRADPHAPDTTPTRWSPYGLRLAAGDPARYVASGRAVVQDEASQLAALALTRVSLSDDASDPGPDLRWLDLCAGPGGKARLLAGLAAQRGARLVASDVRPHRAARVLDALRRGDHNHADHNRAELDAAVIAADGRHAPWLPGTFDRVLADVPCSNLGSLRRRPEARWRKTPDDVPELAAIQRDLLDVAIESVRPGGVVAYVTCSPHLAETRDVVTAVADRRGDVTILDAPAVLADVPRLDAFDPRFAQFWPHRHGTDAIFLSLLSRRSPPGRF